MDKLPDEVRARLEEHQIDVTALEELIARQPAPEHRHYLRTLISSEGVNWGLSAEEGTVESFLIDKAFDRCEGYQSINKPKD